MNIFCSSPSKQHWTAVKRILRYLKETSNYGLSYLRNDNNDTLVGYSDAEWAGDVNDRKSTSGYLFTPISFYFHTKFTKCKVFQQGIVVLHHRL